MRRYLLIIPIAVLVSGLIGAGLWRAFLLAEHSISDSADLTREDVEHFELAKLPEPSEVLVILGRALAVFELQYPSGVQKVLRPRFDHEFRARMKVLEVLYGRFNQPEIEIESYVHLLPGPGFATQDAVVIYLTRHGNRWIQEKYQYDVAHPIAGGEWAICGRWTFRFAPDDPPLEPEPIEFDPPVVFDLSTLGGTRKASRYSPGTLLQGGSSARCVKGVRLSRLVDPLREVAPLLLR
ncbi:MAG: hypothetical protein R3F35_11695 [Myxococcota bacterium]